MISEISAPKTPKLKLPEFVINNKLDVIPPPWPAHHSFIMFVEKCKSGKSSLLSAFITHCKLYKNKL